MNNLGDKTLTSTEMKILLIVFISLFAFCGKPDQPTIFGSWALVIDPKVPNPGTSDSLVVERPDILKLYILQNGNPVDSMFGNFRLDSTNSRLTSKYGTNEFHFEIIKLTNSSMQVRQEGTKVIQQFRRLSK